MTTGFAILARDLLGRAGTSRSFKAGLASDLEMEGVAHELELLGCHVSQDHMRCMLTVSGSDARVEVNQQRKEDRSSPRRGH